MANVEIPFPSDLQAVRPSRPFIIHKNVGSFFTAIVELGKEAYLRFVEGRIKDRMDLLYFLATFPSHVCFTARETFAEDVHEASMQFDYDPDIEEWRNPDSDEFFEADDRYLTMTMPLYGTNMKIKVYTDVLSTTPRTAKACKTTVDGIEVHEYTLPTHKMTRDAAREMMRKTEITAREAKWNPEEICFDSDYEPYVAIIEVVG